MTRYAIGGVLGALLMLGVGVVLNVFDWMPDVGHARWSNLVGIALVFLLFVFSAIGFPGLILGADGRLSTSKFQAWLWTIPLLYGIGAAAYLISTGIAGPGTSVPKWLLLAATTGTLTAIGAKGITTFKLQESKQLQIETPARTAAVDAGDPTPARKWRLADLWSDDNGAPQLTKAQLLLFTLVALVTYIGQIVVGIASHAPGASLTLPDLDPTFLALAGIGQVAYLGRKTFDADTPLVASVEPNPIDFGLQGSGTVVLKGANLGSDPTSITVTGLPQGLTYSAAVIRADEEIALTLSRLTRPDNPLRFQDLTPEALVRLEVAGVRGNEFRLLFRASADGLRIGPSDPAMNHVVDLLGRVPLQGTTTTLGQHIRQQAALTDKSLGSILLVYQVERELIFRMDAKPGSSWSLGAMTASLQDDYDLFAQGKGAAPTAWAAVLQNPATPASLVDVKTVVFEFKT